MTSRSPTNSESENMLVDMKSPINSTFQSQTLNSDSGVRMDDSASKTIDPSFGSISGIEGGDNRVMGMFVYMS